MRIEHPNPQRLIIEYDFSFSSTHFLTMTIDPKFDTIEFGEHEIKAVLGGREKNGVKSPAEEVVIYKNHLITHTRRERLVNDFHPDQLEDIKTIVKPVSKLVH